MIPKKIHYCWFGKGEKPKLVLKCIESWKKYCPDYEIVEWNEENFDIENNLYCKQAYEMKKYAFVSDVARAQALYYYGGIYMDTDVEVLKSLDDLLEEHCVLGFEEGDYIATSFMASEKKHELFKEFCEYYDQVAFIDANGILRMNTNVEKITQMLLKRGLIQENKEQKLISEIHVYEKEYFSPYDYINCIYEYTENSFCVHHFYVSWMPVQTRVKKKIKSCVVKVIGKNNMVKLRKRWINQNPF